MRSRLFLIIAFIVNVVVSSTTSISFEDYLKKCSILNTLKCMELTKEWIYLLCADPIIAKEDFCVVKHLTPKHKNEFIRYLWYDFGHVQSRTNNGKPMSDERNQQKHRNLRHIWKHVQPLLENNNLTYWADGGTLLGVYRDGGMIPWDDDIDLMITNDSLERLLLMKTELERMFNETGIHLEVIDMEKFIYKELSSAIGFDVSEVSKWNNVWHGKMIQFQYKDSWCDVFSLIKEKKQWINMYPGVRYRFPDEWFEDSNVFPLKTYDFGEGQTIKGPHNPEPYFERNYGMGWKTPHFSHQHFETGKDNVQSILHNLVTNTSPQRIIAGSIVDILLSSDFDQLRNTEEKRIEELIN